MNESNESNQKELSSLLNLLLEKDRKAEELRSEINLLNQQLRNKSYYRSTLCFIEESWGWIILILVFGIAPIISLWMKTSCQ